MKSIYVFIFFFCSIQLSGQLIYDEWEEIIPFSKTEKYKDIIKTSEIHTLVLPAYNNDSLFKASNNGKSPNEVGNVYAAGFPIDTIINVMKDGVSFEIDEGTLWIYTIESPTAQGITARVKKVDIPSGAYLGFIGEDYVGHDPEIISRESISISIYDKLRDFTSHVTGHRITIEYFEPKNIDYSPDIIIYQIGYSYVSMNQRIRDQRLKRGAHGTAKYIQCQHDVKCPEVQGWENEAKAIGMITIYFIYHNDDFRSRGTCFFINKGGDYSVEEKPFIVTCGHLFNPLMDSVNHIYYDISNNFNDIDIHVEYINKTCNYDKLVYGKTIGKVDLLELGSSYNKDILDPYSSYIESEDFALLQTNKTVEKLGRYDISYAGWAIWHDFLEEGYAAIGHPGGDAMKVNIDDDMAYESSEQDKFGLYFDLGVTEKGFSGSPIFNSDKQVVGWLCSGGGNCNTLGTVQSTCGEWWIFHNFNYNYFDPELVYNQWWFSYEPEPPPAHCYNCVTDGDETDVDCGGSCKPCGMADVTTLKLLQDIPPDNTVQSRWSLIIEPEPADQIILTSNNYVFKAGQNIHINKSFSVPLGGSLVAEVDPVLTEEPTRGCDESCISVANYFTPDGDGNLDFLIMSQAFITEYSILIWDRWGNTKFTSNNNIVSTNGLINIWDGSGGITSGEKYFGAIDYLDCEGNTHTHTFFCYPFF